MRFVPVDPSGILTSTVTSGETASALVCLKTLASKQNTAQLELKTGVLQLVKRRAESFA